MKNPSKDWVLTQCPKVLIEAIAFHTLLLNLGFSPDEIFLAVTDADITLVLKAQGKEESLGVGVAECDFMTTKTHWEQLLTQWNTGGGLSEEDRDKIYLNSRSYKLYPKILVVLLSFGFNVSPLKGYSDRDKIIEGN